MLQWLTGLQHGVSCGHASPLLNLQAAPSTGATTQTADRTRAVVARNQPSFRVILVAEVIVMREGGNKGGMCDECL